jgi:serine/threonine-protein phosphatase 4 regulatory subunit 1
LLGEHTSETELLSTFHLYLKDVDEVKVGVIKNLAGFLGALSADYRFVGVSLVRLWPAFPSPCPAVPRESYLPILDEIQSCTSPLNWRFRMLLAEQFPQLTELFSPAATCSVVTSVMLKILDDPVWIVRETACAGVPSLLRRLAAADPQWEADVIVKLHKFSVAKSYKCVVACVGEASMC